jgi:hypothetical protein
LWESPRTRRQAATQSDKTSARTAASLIVGSLVAVSSVNLRRAASCVGARDCVLGVQPLAVTGLQATQHHVRASDRCALGTCSGAVHLNVTRPCFDRVCIGDREYLSFSSSVHLFERQDVEGQGNCGCPVGNAQLLVDVLQMLLDSEHRDPELDCHLFRRCSLHELPQDLSFAF